MLILFFISLFIGTGSIPEDIQIPRIYLESIISYTKPKNTSYKGRKQSNRLQSRKILDK
jgi:hypothetical protein